MGKRARWPLVQQLWMQGWAGELLGTSGQLQCPPRNTTWSNPCRAVAQHMPGRQMDAAKVGISNTPRGLLPPDASLDPPPGGPVPWMGEPAALPGGDGSHPGRGAAVTGDIQLPLHRHPEHPVGGHCHPHRTQSHPWAPANFLTPTSH